MLVKQLMVVALVVLLFSQHSTVSPKAAQPLLVTSAGSKSRNITAAVVKGLQAVLATHRPKGQPSRASRFESTSSHERTNSKGTTGASALHGNKWELETADSHTNNSHFLYRVDVDQEAKDLPAGPPDAKSSRLTKTSRGLVPRQAPQKNIPRSLRVVITPQTQSLDLEVADPEDRLLPLFLMDDPLPPEGLADCSYDDATPTVAMTTTPVTYEPIGCASCELDDDGDLAFFQYQDDDDGQSSTDVEYSGPLGGRPRPVVPRGDTFSAEDRRARPVRFSDQPSANCTCSVGDQVTTCSGGGADHFCDLLPRTDTPSGILDVSFTNISVLSAGSLAFAANVSVLRLAWNEVSRVEPGVFSNMTKLTNLSLAHNQLSELAHGSLQGAVHLREVVLAYNRFTELTHATRALSVDVTPELAHLNIGGNNFSAIGPDDFAPMRDVPLQDLQLHENHIRDIDNRTFLELKHLRRLRLRNNELSIQTLVDLVEAMADSALEMIDLSMVGKYTISDLKPVMNAISNSNISSIQLNNYCFPSLYGFDFPKLPKIKALGMRGCGIKYIYPNAFSEFTSLEVLDLADNYLTYPPSAVILPTLVSLDLSRPGLQTTNESKPAFALTQYRFRNMVNLKYLDLSHNNITEIERGAFVGLENLTVLLLENAELEQIANFSFSMMESLSELHLSRNRLGRQAFEHLWQGLTGLTVLLLDRCNISTSDLNLSEMPRMELLNLTHNALGNLTSSTFRGVSSLNVVDLSHNGVVSWNERVFSDTHDLEQIYLRHNRITWIASAMAEDFLELDLRVLMLGYNPFYCSCHLHDWLDGQFQEEAAGFVMPNWTHKHGNSDDGYITNDIDDCFCDSPEPFQNMSVLEFYAHARLSPCAAPRSPAEKARLLLTMLPIFVSGMLLALAVRIIYKNRWYLRYWLFKLTSKRWLKKLRKGSEGYMYDAFVSYSSEDANFVMQMINQLEKTPPFYRLCVYERDFEIGNVISECILESINTSRKSILILTDHFAKSHWCRWEMNLVQCRLFEQTRDDLILVKLGKIKSRHLTPTIRYLMRTRIYIEWGPSEQQQRLFWERLRSALRRPGGSPELPRTV